MARGITEEEVHQAADAIVVRGERPTIERIRAELGRGSPNTVKPSDVVELARKIWQQVLPKATELAESQLGEAASAVSARNDRLTQAEAALELERRQLAETRIALDRRIGELEAALLARDELLKEAKSTSQRTGAELKAAQADAASAQASLAKAQAVHVAEVSKLSERLAGSEKRLMERLAQEMTTRDVDATASRKRIKLLDEDLRATRKLLDEQSAGSLQLQAGLRAELDGLRKLLSRPAIARSKPGSAASRARSQKKLTSRDR